jgi:hypothetical protein
MPRPPLNKSRNRIELIPLNVRVNKLRRRLHALYRFKNYVSMNLNETSKYYLIKSNKGVFIRNTLPGFFETKVINVPVCNGKLFIPKIETRISIKYRMLLIEKRIIEVKKGRLLEYLCNIINRMEDDIGLLKNMCIPS